jgi:probable HAF family extracellular repeat protein
MVQGRHMPKIRAVGVGFCLLTLSIAVRAETYTYRLSEIAKSSIGFAINNSGYVTGTGNPCDGCDREAFLWTGKKPMSYLGPLSPDPFGFEWSEGQDINNLDQMTGHASFILGQTFVTHAFLWDGALKQDLGSLGGDSAGYAINRFGHVTGDSWTADGELQAFLWDGQFMEGLGTLAGPPAMHGAPQSSGRGINASGQITGWSHTGVFEDNEFKLHAFLWQNGLMQDLGTLGGSFSVGNDINATGHVTGIGSTTDDAETHAFLWHDGLMEDLGTLGGSYSEGRAINNLGQVIGLSDLANGESRPFLWERGTMHDVHDLIAASDPLKPYVTLFQADDINNLGQIVTFGRNSLIRAARAYLVSPAYKISAFVAPTHSSWKRGSTIKVAVRLLDANDDRIPDSRAALLAADPCRVKLSATGAQTLSLTCMTYDPATDQFVASWNLKTTGIGTASIQVRANYGFPGPLKAIRSKSITITN